VDFKIESYADGFALNLRTTSWWEEESQAALEVKGGVIDLLRLTSA
jgi:hypothetical protein